MTNASNSIFQRICPTSALDAVRVSTDLSRNAAVAASMAPILAAMKQSELILFCAPTYVFHVPRQMKTLLDHFAYRWMVHRPDLSFLRKQAVIINTAASGGMRSTVRDIKDSTMPDI